MISAGEVHLPGRPKDIVGLKALAIVAVRAFANVRPAGVKVHAGAPILELGLEEADFAELAAAGVNLIGEVGLGSVKTGAQAAPMLDWARRHGMVSTFHTGGPSIAGSSAIRADVVLEARPDIVGHINGGTTALPDADIEQLVASGMAIEIVHCGNGRAALHAIGLAREAGALDRVILGNDAPSGTGVVPLGILRTMAHLASLGGIAPEVAVCLATGNTARVHRLETGTIAVGREADIALVDAPAGLRRRLRARRPRDRRPARRRDDPHRRQPHRRPQPQHAAGGTRSGGRQGPGHRRRRALSAVGGGMHFGLRLPSFALGDQTASLAEMGAYLRRAEDLGFETAMLIDHLLVAPPAYRTTWLEPITLLAALSGVTRTIQLGTLVLVLPFREPVAVREAVGDARPAVRRPVDPRRRGGLDGGRVRGRRHPAPRARRPDERAAGADHRAVDAGAGDVRGPLLPRPRPLARSQARPAAAPADLDRRRDAAVREDLRPERAHRRTGPAPDREVREDVGPPLLRDGRDGRPGLGRPPPLHARVRAAAGGDVARLLELRARAAARRAPRGRRAAVPRVLGHGPRLLAAPTTCWARRRRSRTGSAPRSRPSAASTTSCSTR